ncbi:MAG: hypothetical protein ACSW8J_09730 [bacterium]
MSTTYTWRPNGGRYYSSSGSSAAGDDHFYYSSNRAFRMDFNAPTVDKKTISIKSAILRVYIGTANSATLTIGYNYSTSFDNRKSLLAKITGVSMGTKTGSKTIDITSIVQAYCRDGQTGKFYLWGYGTGGSSSNSNFRGFNPSSSYSSQRPYITLTYDTSRARIYTNGEWKTAVPYVYKNGLWQPAAIKFCNNGSWE